MIQCMDAVLCINVLKASSSPSTFLFSLTYDCGNLLGSQEFVSLYGPRESYSMIKKGHCRQEGEHIHIFQNVSSFIRFDFQNWGPSPNSMASPLCNRVDGRK